MPGTPLETDSTIRWKIEQELLGDPRTAKSHVGIAVVAGAVSLSGRVSSLPEKLLLESMAFRVPGTSAIADALTVEIPGSHGDADIALSASLALRAAVNIPEDSVHVVVDRGAVTLTGVVAWEFQREAARRCVRDIPGVIVIDDNIILEHREPSSDTERKLEAAFARSARLGGRGLRVSCDAGVVTLHGTVGSWKERREAIRTAWSAPGITQVSCLLAIRDEGQNALMD